VFHGNFSNLGQDPAVALQEDLPYLSGCGGVGDRRNLGWRESGMRRSVGRRRPGRGGCGALCRHVWRCGGRCCEAGADVFAGVGELVEPCPAKRARSSQGNLAKLGGQVGGRKTPDGVLPNPEAYWNSEALEALPTTPRRARRVTSGAGCDGRGELPPKNRWDRGGWDRLGAKRAEGRQNQSRAASGLKHRPISWGARARNFSSTSTRSTRHPP